MKVAAEAITHASEKRALKASAIVAVKAQLGAGGRHYKVNIFQLLVMHRQQVAKGLPRRQRFHGNT